MPTKTKTIFLFFFLLFYWFTCLFYPSSALAQITFEAENADYVINGTNDNDKFGWSVSSLGDLNQDGYDDVLVGAQYAADVGSDRGRVYIFFGSSSWDSSIDAENADVVINGVNDSDSFVHGSAGDFNNDGYDDVAVGAYAFDSWIGQTYIFFGSSSWDASIDAENADVVVTGTDGADGLGISLSLAGDIDNDGYDDLVVGADYASDEGYERGSVYIIFGSSSTPAAIAAADADVIIRGTDNSDWFGHSVSSAGDIDNDGYDDLVVGAENVSYAGNDRGGVYIFYGSSSWDASINAENADVFIDGTNDNDGFGTPVSSAGDFNNDGYDDLVVGAQVAEDEGSNRGRAYIFYGSSSWGASINAENADVVMNGTNDSDYFGQSLSSVGDVNHDGYDDLVVGAGYADPGGTSRGSAYIFFGSSSMSSSIDAENADVVINGSSDGGKLGGAGNDGGGGFTQAIASAGDFNNDGWQDFIVGAYGAEDEGSNPGQAYIFDLNYANPAISVNDIYATFDPQPDILSSAFQDNVANIGGIHWSFRNILPGYWNSCPAQDGEYNHYSESGSCDIHGSDLPEGQHSAYFRSYDTNFVYLPPRYYAKDDFIVDYTSPLGFTLISPLKEQIITYSSISSLIPSYLFQDVYHYNTNAQRPTFSWLANANDTRENSNQRTDQGSGIDKYSFRLEKLTKVEDPTGKEEDQIEDWETVFEIPDLSFYPFTGETSKDKWPYYKVETDTYTLEYLNFDDDQLKEDFPDTYTQSYDNNIIYLTTKDCISPDPYTGQPKECWGQGEDDGKLTAASPNLTILGQTAKYKWIITAYDQAGNTASQERIIYYHPTSSFPAGLGGNMMEGEDNVWKKEREAKEGLTGQDSCQSPVTGLKAFLLLGLMVLSLPLSLWLFLCLVKKSNQESLIFPFFSHKIKITIKKGITRAKCWLQDHKRFFG